MLQIFDPNGIIITAIGHFRYTQGMSLMMPAFIPFKKQLVYGTGIIEVIAAVGLLLPSVQKLTGWLLILFFALILPANINGAVKHVDYENGTYEGPGVNYLWFRFPLQLLFIAWVYWFAVHN